MKVLAEDEKQPTKEELKQKVIENQEHPDEKQSLLNDLISGRGPKAPMYDEKREE